MVFLPFWNIWLLEIGISEQNWRCPVIGQKVFITPLQVILVFTINLTLLLKCVVVNYLVLLVVMLCYCVCVFILQIVIFHIFYNVFIYLFTVSHCVNVTTTKTVLFTECRLWIKSWILRNDMYMVLMYLNFWLGTHLLLSKQGHFSI